MKIKKINKFLNFFLSKNVIGITLYPFGIYLREDYFNNKYTINHEKIHYKQQKEMLVLPFYIWYVVEWLWKTGIYGKNAYRNISFEREAYKYESDLNYIQNRKIYSWINFLCR